ncbi:ABC transporter substrate-binding protein [Arthrobacter sp. SDTb3-6]|uniref:ABC transporter substrate-binding protein n=1 Tax=Arthrobacter sp. SDTb3-6 TaxID=2713571 RepID=UPI0035242D8C
MAGLAGCGSDTGSPAANGAGADKAATIRVSVAAIQFETAYLAQEKGMFKKQGLNVEIVNGADPASQLAQVVSGDVNIATGSWINVATSVAKGLPVSVIAGNGVVDPKTDNSGVLVSKRSGITSLKGLAGKTIGVVGVKSGGDIPVLQALEGAGVDVNGVKEVAIPYSGMQAALEQGTVDAVVPVDQFYRQMLGAGFVSISNPVREYQANMPVTVWTAKKDWLASNGAEATKFVAAMKEAVAYYKDPANLAAVQKVNAEVNQIDVAKAPKAFVPADTTINEAEAQAGIDAMVHFGLLKKSISVDDVLWSGAPRRASAKAQ